MSVRYVQLVCSEGHRLLATAYVSENGAPDPAVGEALKAAFRELVANGSLSGECRACYPPNPVISLQDAATFFESIDIAEPFLLAGLGHRFVRSAELH